MESDGRCAIAMPIVAAVNAPSRESRRRATVVADMARGDRIDPDRAKETVGQWADKLAASKQGAIKESSALRNTVTLERQIKPHWDDVPLGSVPAVMCSHGLACAAMVCRHHRCARPGACSRRSLRWRNAQVLTKGIRLLAPRFQWVQNVNTAT